MKDARPICQTTLNTWSVYSSARIKREIDVNRFEKLKDKTDLENSTENSADTILYGLVMHVWVEVTD